MNNRDKEIMRILDSATKYPSIETFHVLGKDGRLVKELTDPGKNLNSFTGVPIFTEKVNGLNTRVLHFYAGLFGGPDPWDWIIGSRDMFLTARNDRVPNPAHGIVEYLEEEAERLFCVEVESTSLVVIYREIYGGNLTKASCNYTHDGSIGDRVFDVQLFNRDELREICKMPIERVSALRESGELPGRWMNDHELDQFCKMYNLTRVPVLSPVTLSGPPTDLREAYDWLLCQIAHTKVALGSDKGGDAEGVVVRTPDRRAIVKLRFENYARTFQK